MLLTAFSFVFFTALVGLLTWLITRHKKLDSTDGYFLAGRSLGAGVIAGSLLLTNLSTEQLVGLNGAAYKDGLAVMAWEVVAGLSLVVMAIFFLPRYLRRGITTIPEFLAGRFDDTTQAITNFVFILAYMLILLPIILYTGAMGLKEILNVSALTGIESESAVLWLTVWVIGILGSIYAIFGGLRSVAVSDTLNGFGLLVGGLMIAYLGLRLVGDGSMAAGLETLAEAHPEKLNSLGDADSSVPWPTLFTGVLLLNMFYWTTNQQIIQRTFAASTLAEGQKGVLLAATFKILAPIILVLPGIIAFHLYGSGSEAVKPDQAYGTLVRNVLPDELTGFFAAVMVGAILSSFNSALNATATMFSLGVYRRYMHPAASDRATIRAGRAFGTLIALGAMTGAPLLAGQDSIFKYLQDMNGLYFIPIFAVVLVGMLSRRVPAGAANLSLVLGVAVIAAGYWMPGADRWVYRPPAEPAAAEAPVPQPQLEASPGAAGLEDSVEQPGLVEVAEQSEAGEAAEQAEAGPSAEAWSLFPVARFHFLGIVFAGLVALMLAIGAAAPRSVPDRPPVGQAAEAAAALDMRPWPLTVPAGALLVGVVVAIYLYFAS